MLKGILKTVGVGLLTHSSAQHAAIQAARLRRRNLVLVYHRLGAAEGEVRGESAGLMPSLPLGLFRGQIDALRSLGEIVPLRDLLAAETDNKGIRFAITFDDDDRRHVRYALPALRAMGVHATFFLSGRALHGLGPYWWERLEAAIDRHGFHRVSQMLEIAAADPAGLAAACERSPVAKRLLALDSARSDHRALVADDIRSLADAGLEIGFHTLHHPVLVDLPPAEVDRALIAGRRELAKASGRPVELFAYPHGKASQAVSRRVERAGYLAAFTGSGRGFGPQYDRFLLGRWEPGPLEGEGFQAAVALRLNLPNGGPKG